MGKDIKLLNACDHIVDNYSHDIQLCPRCYGKGYYFDIHFDPQGKTVLAEGEIKLQQEMIKIILEDKYSNKYNELWGSEIRSMVGSKNLDVTKSRLEVIIRNTLSYLKNLQLAEAKEWNNLNGSEILDNIEYILITKSGPTGYVIDVSISNQVGNLLIQDIKI